MSVQLKDLEVSSNNNPGLSQSASKIVELNGKTREVEQVSSQTNLQDTKNQKEKFKSIAVRVACFILAILSIAAFVAFSSIGPGSFILGFPFALMGAIAFATAIMGPENMGPKNLRR